MIKHAGSETAGFVADAAIFRGRNVVDLHAHRRRPIVAGSAVIHDAGMIKHRTNKSRGVVAHAAILDRRDMRT